VVRPGGCAWSGREGGTCSVRAVDGDSAGTVGDRDSVPGRLRAALRDALKTRDATAIAALRSALAAIGNAEAAEAGQAPAAQVTHARLAGTVAGLHAAEVERRDLSEAELEAVVRVEVGERLDAACAYERAGRADRAARVRAEAAVLRSVLGEVSGDVPGETPGDAARS
jgi:uncharacterized protein